MSKQGYLCAILLFTVMCWADEPAPASASAATQAPVTSGTQPIRIGRITVQGSFRTRFEDWDWFKGDTGDNSYAYSGNILRLSLSESFESFDWQLEFAVPFLLGLPDNAVASGTQGQFGFGATYYVANNKSQYSAMPFAKQGFLRFKSGSQTFRFGRFEFLDGSEVTPKDATLAAVKRDRIQQRLLGNFGWAHVGRSFDGFQYLYNKPSGTFTF